MSSHVTESIRIVPVSVFSLWDSAEVNTHQARVPPNLPCTPAPGHGEMSDMVCLRKYTSVLGTAV